MSSPIDIKDPRQDSTIQELTGIEKIIRRMAIGLTAVFVFEIISIIVGYIGLFKIKVVTVLWFFYEMLFAIFVIMTPFILIITIPSAGYIIFRYLKQNGNRRATLIVTIAAALNVSALLSIFAFQNAAYHEAIKDIKHTATTEKDWVGKTLPSFTFQNIREGLSSIALKDLAGKPSVLIFWTTYDIPWSSNLKHAHDLYNQKEKLNINILAIAVDESKDDVKRFLDAHQDNMSIYHDPKSSYNHGLSIYGAEKVLVVDSMARLQVILGSPNSLQEIKTALDQIRQIESSSTSR